MRKSLLFIVIIVVVVVFYHQKKSEYGMKKITAVEDNMVLPEYAIGCQFKV